MISTQSNQAEVLTVGILTSLAKTLLSEDVLLIMFRVAVLQSAVKCQAVLKTFWLMTAILKISYSLYH